MIRIPCSLVVRIVGFHPTDRGSIPRGGNPFFSPSTLPPSCCSICDGTNRTNDASSMIAEFATNAPDATCEDRIIWVNDTNDQYHPLHNTTESCNRIAGEILYAGKSLCTVFIKLIDSNTLNVEY